MVWRTALIMVMGLLFLTACATSTGTQTPESGANNPTPEGASSGTSPAETDTPEASSEGDLQQGGTLTRLGADPPTLDPHQNTDARSATFVLEIFGGLVTLDPELNIVPDLAESWDVSQDGTVYTFHLRPDATFHDGKPVTAEDVLWSFERAADPATLSPVADQYLGDIVGFTEKLEGNADTVEGLRVIDERTFEVTIDAPKSYFLAKLTYPTAFVLDRENVEANPDGWTQDPNGTGPFELAQYDVGQTLRLVRNEDYHLGPPYLDEVEFILSGGDAMIMYENGEIDLTGVGLASLERVRDPSSPLNDELLQTPPSFSTYYVGMNVNEPPLDDVKVRQALNLAVDKETIATTALEGLVAPANGILPPGFPGYNPDLRGYDYNPERARQLLQESSYGDNLDDMPTIILTVPGSFGSSVGLDIEAILRSWEQELGIQVEIQQTEWATFLEDLHGRRFQMFSVGWVADYPDPENFLDQLFYTESSNNQTGYTNAQVDSLLEQARVERDEEARMELYHRVEQLIMEDAPWVPLWHRGEQFLLLKPHVEGYHLTQMTIPKLRYVYLDEN